MEPHALRKDEWQRTAAELSRRRAGWFVSAEEQVRSLSEDDVETSMLVEERPFRALVWRDGRLVLEYEGDRELERLAVERPAAWSRLENEAGGADHLRVEDAEGRTTVLAFRRP